MEEGIKKNIQYPTRNVQCPSCRIKKEQDKKYLVFSELVFSEKKRKEKLTAEYAEYAEIVKGKNKKKRLPRSLQSLAMTRKGNGKWFF